MRENISSIRKDYLLKKLDEKDVDKSPFKQFGKWFEEAITADVLEPNAMILATTTSDGKPSSRVVLLKGFDENGLVFFTNYNSRKGKQISQNPHVSVVFFWPQLERQIRIEGLVEKVSDQESNEYFDSRPIGSKIGAWASPQSETIPNREFLELKLGETEKEFKNKTIPKPIHWGGYRLIPNYFEFWQGRPNRLHDRIKYTLRKNKWITERLAP